MKGMAMFRILIAGLAATFALIGSAVAQDQNDLRSKILALGWIKAPATAPIAGVAHFKLTNGQMALDASDTSRFLQLNGNPPADNNFAVTAPSSDGSQFSPLIHQVT
jgi:hypothetical protein